MVEVAVRPMTAADVERTVEIQLAAFLDLDERLGEPQPVVTDIQLKHATSRHRYFIAHDPDGSWVATADGVVVGCGLALRRGSLWGLSLLVVAPDAQSSGAGRQLLNATLRYSAGCERATIQSSRDVRAIRAYATSGFDLFPQVAASGRPSLDTMPRSASRARSGDASDAGFADLVDQDVRRAPRGTDHPYLAEVAAMYVVDDEAGRGYAYVRDGEVYALAATNDATASDLLWRCLRHLADNGLDATVEHITGEQQWAVAACLAARLAIKPSGPVFWRGTTPPRSYLPSGGFL